ncbi:MAG: DUF4476 domain-containing protein, partial [Bacteroidota bacterium]
MLVSETYGQISNAILFTENGERFTAILNGLRQNDKPETNVKVTKLNANTYKLKVIFEDVALGQSNFNLFIEPGTESTYIIKKNKKNEYVLRLLSFVPIDQAPPSPPTTAVVVFNPTAPTYNPTTTETVVQQTTVTTTSNPPTGAGVTMGVNINETNGSVSMNVSAYENNGVNATQQTTITTTTTTTNAGISTNQVQPTNAPPAPIQYVPGYTGPIGCPMPMPPSEFEGMKKTISSKSFEDSKMSIAKQVINSNCLTSQQVKEVVSLFTFEENKLEFAKYAYTRTYDISNYYKINDAFTFESSIEELNEY